MPTSFVMVRSFVSTGLNLTADTVYFGQDRREYRRGWVEGNL